MNDKDARVNLSWWITRERAHHADIKYANGTETRDKLVDEIQTIGYGPECEQFVLNYFTRVKALGLHSPLGRQAMGKAIVTLMHYLETAIAVYGPMPPGGLPSGETDRRNLRKKNT